MNYNSRISFPEFKPLLGFGLFLCLAGGGMGIFNAKPSSKDDREIVNFLFHVTTKEKFRINWLEIIGKLKHLIPI